MEKNIANLCRAAIDRYFYNPESVACEQFIYGGCEGNGNNFETLEQCRARCQGEYYNNRATKSLHINCRVVNLFLFC